MDNNISYIINQLGEENENYFYSVAPPIIQTSNFTFKTIDELRAAFEDEMRTYLYSRGLNPTVDILRKKLAALDGAEDCLVVNSGSSAIHMAVMNEVKAGDHIISVKKPYTWAQRLFDDLLPKFNVSTTYVEGTSISDFENSIQSNTKIIYLESPNSWDYRLQDIRAVAELAKKKNIVTIIDNTYCTPLYQNVIGMGIDVAIQSASKYISGHSDVIAGVISSDKKRISNIFNKWQNNNGAGIKPFDAWLLLRGLRTMPTRLKQISVTTQKIFAYLKANSKIEKILYCFDEDFEQYELAKKQMKDAFGLISIFLKPCALVEIEKFCQNLKYFKMAVSWGGHESLIIPKCATIAKEKYNAQNPDCRKLRLYFGLEDADELIADLDSAFKNLDLL